MLVAELYQKGVSREAIEEVLPEEIDEKAMAQKVVTRAARRFNKLNWEDLRVKLSEYLARRGFSWEIIREVVDEAIKSS